MLYRSINTTGKNTNYLHKNLYRPMEEKLKHVRTAIQKKITYATKCTKCNIS